MDKVRLNLSVEADIPDLLTELAGGPRQRGEFLSRLIRAMHAGELSAQQENDLEALRLQMMGLAGKLKSIEGEVIHLRSQLAAVVADRAGR